MNPESCPNPEELRSFVRCNVSEQEADSISEHLEHCPACEETVVGLERDGDTIAERIKQAAAQPTFAHEPECQQMMQTLLDGAPMSSAELAMVEAPFQIADILRDYQIVAKLGEGGMGTVYKAMHQRLKKTVALKVLPTHRIGDRAAVARFEREMEVLGQLNHPHIVQALDAGEHDGQHFLVMEYVEGTDLSEIVRRRGPLPVNAACEIIAQAAMGLQYAHDNGLVHRDIKPSNLMLSVSTDKRTNEVIAAVVKILDLGLARLHTDDKQNGPELTTDGQIMGTLDYMAPEQGDDSHAVDIRADIYSLGATLYKLLTGEALFGGERHRSVMQKLTALATEPPPSVRGRRPEVPEPLAAIIARMVSKRPQDRFATPAEVASALQPFRAGAELPALLGLSSRPSEAVPPSPTVQLASHNQPPKTGRPFAAAAKWFYGAAALFAIILTITTKNGTIEVESPDGQLPDDLKIVVSRGGDRVEVLQADNQWRASVAGGQIQLMLQGGEDRFELQDSTLTVSRFGKSVVTLRVKQAAAAPVVVEKDKVQPKPVAVNASHEKPFVVVRKGQRSGEFNSLYGAMSATATGDVIEVHSHGPVTLTMPEAINKPLHLRAGKGYRPMLVLKERTVINQRLVIEDCDLDHRAGSWHAHVPVLVAWEFRRCRFWGGIVGHVSVPRLVLEDCIFDTMCGFNLAAIEPTEIVVTNCAVRSWQHFLGFVDGTAPATVRLSGNTFRFYGGGSLARIDAPVKSPIKFEVTGNIFEFWTRQSGMPVVGADLPSHVDWVGQENLYCGKWFQQHADGKLVGEGLGAWNKFWKQPEQNSRELAAVSFAGMRGEDWTSLERLAGIRTAVEQIKVQTHLDQLGPDWSLVGVGDNYVRALAAQGKAVPEDRLRPEAHPDGPIVIIRKDVEFKGLLTLTAAFDAAESGDVIEIRTDDPIPGADGEGKSRRLTLRAAPGYSPIINSSFYTAQDRLIVEGLTFRQRLANSGKPNWSWNGKGPPFLGNGSFEQITNCVFLNPDAMQVWGWFRGEGNQIPAISNCVLGVVAAGIPGGKKLQIKNSVLATAWISVDGKKEPGHLEISNSLFWSPGSSAGGSSIYMNSPLNIASRDSVFAPPESVVIDHDFVNQFRKWTGTRNVFASPSAFVSNTPQQTPEIYTLNDLRKAHNTDSDSIELRPFSFDAGNWRIWRERSTAYEPLANGTEFGADIDRLLKALIGDTAAAK